MSDDAEQQAEEIEVLKSIYEGDENFKQVNATTYHYKYEDGDKSFILEIVWGPTYPTEKPNINLEIFYNQSLLPAVKEKILSIVNAEAEQWVGCAMTYTLFECLKERVSEILAEQTEEAVVARVEKIAITEQTETTKKPEKKEQLSKAQKRRAWDRAEIGRAGEKPRGWDWVSLNGVVRNLTSWLEQQFKVCKCFKSCSCPINNWFCGNECVERCNCFKYGFSYCDRKRLAMTILAYAGKDVSSWFKQNEWLHYIHPVAGSQTPYYRYGPGDEQPVVPSTRWRPLDKPWWLDDSNIVGKVTEKTRPIRITNTLTGSSVTLEVCSEETIYQIMMRYLPHNCHMNSYTWRYLGKGLDYNKTLEQNGVKDEREIFNDVALPENFYIPDLLLYYNDDLTEDPPKICHCLDRECIRDRPK